VDLSAPSSSSSSSSSSVYVHLGILSVMYQNLTRIIGAATDFAEGRIKHPKKC
jgi:hypothetical protein